LYVYVDVNTDDPKDSPLILVVPSHMSTDSEGLIFHFLCAKSITHVSP